MLKLSRVIRHGTSRPPHLRGRQINVRLSFESYGQPEVPASGTRAELNKLRQQWRGE